MAQPNVDPLVSVTEIETTDRLVIMNSDTIIRRIDGPRLLPSRSVLFDDAIASTRDIVEAVEAERVGIRTRNGVMSGCDNASIIDTLYQTDFPVAYSDLCAVVELVITVSVVPFPTANLSLATIAMSQREIVGAGRVFAECRTRTGKDQRINAAPDGSKRVVDAVRRWNWNTVKEPLVRIVANVRTDRTRDLHSIAQGVATEWKQTEVWIGRQLHGDARSTRTSAQKSVRYGEYPRS